MFSMYYHTACMVISNVKSTMCNLRIWINNWIEIELNCFLINAVFKDWSKTVWVLSIIIFFVLLYVYIKNWRFSFQIMANYWHIYNASKIEAKMLNFCTPLKEESVCQFHQKISLDLFSEFQGLFEIQFLSSLFRLSNDLFVSYSVKYISNF